jgi:hypothetical protein
MPVIFAMSNMYYEMLLYTSLRVKHIMNTRLRTKLEFLRRQMQKFLRIVAGYLLFRRIRDF